MEREGVDCPHEYAKAQMRATRELWGKNDGVQAHHVIQSFKPGEIDPALANQIGQELAREIARGYECVVYTHTDREHIHNHIVINSVSYENGRKFHAHGKEAIERVREASDRLCQERELSIVREPYAQQRYSQAEYGLAKRGEMSWKDEIREVIDYEKQHSKSYEDFKRNLLDKYNIEIKERGKNISFKHPDTQKFVRGKTLGLAYERGTLEDGFDRQIERRTSDRGTEISNGKTREFERVAEADNRSERSHESIHPYEHGQRNSRENDFGQRDRQNQIDKRADYGRDALDIGEARESLTRQRRSIARSYDRVTERDTEEQRLNSQKDGRDRERSQERDGRDQSGREKHFERNSFREPDYGYER